MTAKTGLTPAQQAAVDHLEGPLMVLAGPGSGKTRVITHRIVNLLRHGAKPKEILALTFTNKAAREMAERVDRLLGGIRIEVSTFHRFCARMLRRWPEMVGLQHNFTILDSSDQAQLVRNIMKEVGFDSTLHDPRRVLNRISTARNELITAETFRMRHEDRPGDLLDAVVYEVFPEYEQQLIGQNSVDFDTLLLHVVEMLQHNEELREYLDLHFRFVLVDEYQDTNLAQYEIVRSLSQQCPNLCVTGDPDQSIYGWRGARPANIQQFETDFPQREVVSLDQNFRSTAAIVRCADSLISHNPRRHRNALFTENEEGEPVRLHVYPDAESEAQAIAAGIAQTVADGSRNYSDFAIFYRVNALSRSLETALARFEVPFQVAAGFSFYERAEVRDLIGYLRLVENPNDDIAFRRIVNRPARGIGEKTVAKLAAFAQQHELSLLEAAGKADEVPQLTARSRKPLKTFFDMLQHLQEHAAEGHVTAVLERLIAEIDYLSLWKDENDEVDQDRLANVHELINAARLYEDSLRDAEEPGSLQGFLELVGLTSEADSVDQDRGAVTLMTMHAAKGLEFPVVYVIGVESGLIPHDRAVRNGDPAAFQEERRLLFVALTRAMQELHLTQTRQRNFRGTRRYTIRSPYLAEIPVEEEGGDDSDRLAYDNRDDHRQRAKQRYEQAQEHAGLPRIMSAADLERRLSGSTTGRSSADPADSQPQRTKQLMSDSNVTERAAPRGEGSDHPFVSGMTVRHPRYGRGVVIDASYGSSRATVTVLFDIDDREETFVAAHCPLQPIGSPPA